MTNDLNAALQKARERKKILSQPEMPAVIIRKAQAYDEMFEIIDSLATKKQQLDAREKSLTEYELMLKTLADRMVV